MGNIETLSRKVENINKKAGLAGNISILSFSKFRLVATLFFIFFTTVSLALIVSAWILKFDLKPIAGLEPYLLAFLVTLPFALILSWYAGFTKINEVSAIVFARTGGFRFASFLASIFITSLIILVNAYGVMAGAEISSIYLENKLLNSEEYKTKQAISNVFSKISKSSLGSGYDDLIKGKKQEKNRLKRQQKQEILNFKNSNLVSYQKAENIAWINRKYDKKYSKIAGEIQELTKLQIIQATKNEKLTLEKAEKYQKVEKDKLDYKKSIDEVNAEQIVFYSNIGFIVAIIGEIIDLILALIFFYKVKTNDNNSNEILTIQKNVNAPVMDTIKTHKKKKKKDYQDKDYFSQRAKKKRSKSFKLDEELKEQDFETIKKVALEMSLKQNIFVDDKLKHIIRKKLLAELWSRGLQASTRNITKYYKQMQETGDLTTKSKKQGFLYSENFEEKMQVA